MRNHPLLTEAQKSRYDEFCSFVRQHVEPAAAAWDQEQGVPRDIIALCGQAGFTGGFIPKEFGGGGWDAVTFGLLNEAFGAASSSLTGLFTVQNMVAGTLVKWGTKEQQNHWLPKLATGERVASFAMTEPKVGSDLQAIETTFTPNGDGWLLTGTKKWITYSGIADVFLVFGKWEDQSIACIIPSNSPNITITPLKDMLGFRGVYLSQIEFKGVEIAPENVVGKPGLAIKYVAPFGLHYGRISTAWSSTGLIRACLETAATFVSQRRAAEKALSEHGQIQHLLADMGVEVEAARHFCMMACLAEDARVPEAMERALTAKYFASRAASRAATNTIQIMGAAGCYEENMAARFYRNAKVMEIIEGTNQVLQRVLGKSAYKKYRKQTNPK